MEVSMNNNDISELINMINKMDKKKYIDSDVYTEAKKRIKHIINAFDDIIVCFSGGKDSTMAVYAALNRGDDVKYLLSVISKNDVSYMFHVTNIHLTDLLSKALDI